MADNGKPTLVALHDRREYAIALLTQRFADDVLDMDEFERRVDLAHQATNVATLDRLIEDLEPAETPGTELAVQPQKNELATGSRPESKRIVAIMGGVDRKGSWLVPGKLDVFTMMGGTSLDFREALLPPGVTEIRVRAIIGGVDIIVPPSICVEMDGLAIMGGFEDMNRAPVTPDPGRPLLRVSGVAIMGGVSIETRMPGESRRQARRRRRKERRRLRRQARSLPAKPRRLPRPRKQLTGGDNGTEPGPDGD